VSSLDDDFQGRKHETCRSFGLQDVQSIAALGCHIKRIDVVLTTFDLGQGKSSTTIIIWRKGC
jgi:hypothetical protein